MNKTKIQGVVYAVISLGGISYELVAVDPPRVFLLIMYTLVIGIGLIYIYRIPHQ